MENYEEVLKILSEQFGWKFTKSLSSHGEKLVADTIKALKIAEAKQVAQSNDPLKNLARTQILDYEIRSSWWAKYILWNWLLKLTGIYFAVKVKRKYSRYNKRVLEKQRVKKNN